MPHKGYSTPSQNFDHRRKTQKVFVDRASGDVILRLHETDIVRVTPRGDVVLSTGGWATDKTLNSMNDALELFGMWVENMSGSVTSGRWQVTDSDGTIHPYHNNKSSPRIVIRAKSADDAPRASWLAEAYEVQYTPRPAAAPAAQGPRIAAAPAAAPAGTSAGPRIAAAPAAAAVPARSNGVAAAPAATARPPGIGGSWANIAKSSNPLHQASTGPSSSAAAHNVRVTGPGAASAGRVTGPGASTAAAAGAGAGPSSSSAAPHRTTGPPGFSTGPGSSGAAHAGARPPGVRPPSAAAAAAGAAPSPQRATVTSAPPPPGGGGSSASLHQQFAAMGMHDADDDTHLCVVCMEEPRSIVLVPCGHMALCKGCCEQIVASQQKCPMCCQDVEYHVEVDA